MFEVEQKMVAGCIQAYCDQIGLPQPGLDWKWIPFSGHWGISTSFFQTAAQEAKLQGIKVNVSQRAQEIAQAVAGYLGKPEGFERIEAVRGYLNLYFSSLNYSRRLVDTVMERGENYGHGEPQNMKVMVEFSQPNTHKAFHVGHLRNVILGDSVCRILEFAGLNVVRANYIGDIGLHVIKWLWTYQKNHSGENPGLDKIRWMGDIYAEADRLYEESPEIKADVRALFTRWDRRDTDIVELWKTSRKWSLEGFEQIYHLLDVRFDHIYFESDMEEPGKELVKNLIEKEIARDERPDGPVIVPLDDLLGTIEKFRVLVILRSDGTSLYSTKDLYLGIRKFEEYHLDRSVYVIDARQSLYMQQIFKTLELMGYPWTQQCFHLAYEIVNLPGNVTMSSRDGTVVLLDDLVNEATERALEIVRIKNPDLPETSQRVIAQAVAIGAIKYSMVSRDNSKIVTFDWNTALDFNGQAAPYIQYAYVRANSILRKSGTGVPASEPLETELTASELELIDLISRFPKEVQRAAKEYKPLHIANLAYDLGRAFSDFYNQCPVLQAEEPQRSFRLRLVFATRQVIGNALALLGIKTPDVM
jgi:arginyl-tRNA synthetase